MLKNEQMLDLFDELIEQQKNKLLASGRRIVPHVTSDDLLQPNDFPELENNPLFRYEEGILDGLQVAKAAFLAESANISSKK
jgi:hypothetical protein